MEASRSPAAVLGLYRPHDDTIPSLFASRRAARPNSEVLVCGTRRWTYAELDRASQLLSGLLARHGVAAGDRVALVSQNSDISLILFLALARMGAIFVPINPALTLSELNYILEHCSPRAIVTQEADFARVDGLARKAAAQAATIGAETLGAAANTSAEVLEALLALGGEPPISDRTPEAGDGCVIVYTSGTTGFPKGVLHSHRNYVWAAEAFVERMHLQPSDRLLTILPFFHVNALFYSFGGALAAGGALITAPRFSASGFWDTAAETGATQFNILAAVGNILAKRPRSEYNPAHKIRKIYGGPISAEMYRVFQQEFNVPHLIEGYGMSEIPGACNNPFDGIRKIGSIGKPARHPRIAGDFARLKIVDDDGAALPAGQVGELLVSTPIAMTGYFRDPEQTKAAFADGWLRTGDLAWRDEDGYYYFVARKKDIIRRRGENISGAELDRVLSSHPQILEAAAIGVPAELGDEEILAVLVARPGKRPSEQEILAWCAEHLAAMKIPRYVLFVDSLPHTSSLRVAKFRLKEDPTLMQRAYDRERPAPPAQSGLSGNNPTR